MATGTLKRGFIEVGDSESEEEPVRKSPATFAVLVRAAAIELAERAGRFTSGWVFQSTRPLPSLLDALANLGMKWEAACEHVHTPMSTLAWTAAWCSWATWMPEIEANCGKGRADEFKEAWDQALRAEFDSDSMDHLDLCFKRIEDALYTAWRVAALVAHLAVELPQRLVAHTEFALGLETKPCPLGSSTRVADKGIPLVLNRLLCELDHIEGLAAFRNTLYLYCSAAAADVESIVAAATAFAKFELGKAGEPCKLPTHLCTAALICAVGRRLKEGETEAFVWKHARRICETKLPAPGTAGAVVPNLGDPREWLMEAVWPSPPK